MEWEDQNIYLFKSKRGETPEVVIDNKTNVTNKKYAV